MRYLDLKYVLHQIHYLKDLQNYLSKLNNDQLFQDQA